MIMKKWSKMNFVKIVFGCFLVMVSLLGATIPMMVGNRAAAIETVNGLDDNDAVLLAAVDDGDVVDGRSVVEETGETGEASTKKDSCKVSLEGVGWFVCTVTKTLTKAVDWLYGWIEEILVLDPVSMEDDSPIYAIWQYCLTVTNIVFIIFLLVVIYSQLTGLGISNYGIKKALPKLIITAVLVNLSFLICTVGVDLSNAIGNGLTGLFETVKQTVADSSSAGVSMEQAYDAIAGAGVVAVGAGVVAFEAAEIWMLIPTALGALIAVAAGLFTIALRQAVVALLIMVAPLAIVAQILPNTEGWFKKWKQWLIKMLTFYPVFSVLFGASGLAGFAIMMSAQTGLGILLGIAVQIFPLIFSVSLMKMSGTMLGGVYSKIQGLASRPLAANRAWASQHAQLSRQKHLAAKNTYTPSMRLMSYLSDRRIAREEEMDEHAAMVKNKGLAYNALRKYKKNDLPGKGAERDYEMQARNSEYKQIIERHKNNMNEGLGQLEVVKAKATDAQKARLEKLDAMNIKASDDLKMELARGAKIEHENAQGFHQRALDAVNAHIDLEALKANNTKHEFHGVLGDKSNIERFERMRNIMEGNTEDATYILADAAHAFSAQSQVVQGKFRDLFLYTAPTQDAVNILNKLTTQKNSNDYIDPIVAGLRVLNMRGDTDLVRDQLMNVLRDRKVELGTYASQSLANFFMFDVKGSDPFLRRFGKYINLETAKMFNEGDDRRTRKDITLDEYVNGEYIDYDSEGNIIYEENGQPKIRKAKRKAAVLLKGTSFKDMERTAIAEMNSTIRECSVDIDENGNRTFNYKKFKENQKEIWDAIMPNIIGDQFSFLSGSEQIVALGKGVTGMDVQKHSFDWEGIFGKEIASSLTPEQKKDYLDFMHERTKTFLGGQVPVQIAKTKSDVLESIRNQYAFKDAVDTDNTFLDEAGQVGFKMSDEDYKRFEQERIDRVRKEFVGSYKEDALKGFVKMHQKGYQGEAKSRLIQLLNPDELYKQYFGNGSTNERQNSDDDGAPVSSAGGGDSGTTPIYNEARQRIEDTYRSYNSGGVTAKDVAEFWAAIKDELTSDPNMFGNEVVIDEIENSLPQYTSIATLYVDIINKLFGGFDR